MSEAITRVSGIRGSEGREDARDVFEGIAETVGKVVGWVDAPVCPRAVMRGVENTVGDDVPHDRHRVLHILLHTKRHLPRLVLPQSHVLELLEGLLDGLGAILGVGTWKVVVLASSLDGNVGSCGSSQVSRDPTLESGEYAPESFEV